VTTTPTTRLTRVVAAFVACVMLAVGAAACDPRAEALDGLWINQRELDRLPTSGAAWDRLVKEANSNWGTAALHDNNATHDTSTLAGALVAARTRDPQLTKKTRDAIMSVTKVTRYERVLEMSRNITSYVIAADIVGLPAADDAKFRTFISGLRTKPLQGHSGGKDLTSTALRSTNNWGTMARAAVVAIDLYLGDTKHLDAVVDAHRAWLGENVDNELRYTGTKWHADKANPSGVNRSGAKVNGRNADGVIPEDQRRTGEPTSKPAEKGSYPWEALQGAVVTAVLLDRAGEVNFHAGGFALVRAYNWLHDVNDNPASGDDTWQPWLVNRVAGTKYPTKAASSPGKLMGWTDWTHA